jgi:5-methylthioadenosine/S-adenosylhomocysteine deaminase
MTKLLIKGAAYLVRAADRIERDCDLLIEGNRIAAVGRFTLQEGWECLDAADCAVIPGLINAHTHQYQSFLRGLCDDVSLVAWCEQVLFPAADVIHQDHRCAGDERLGYAWSALASMEMVKAGTTCCIDMDLMMDSVFQAWLEIGFRGVGAITLADRWLPDRLLRDQAQLQQEALAFAAQWHGLPKDSPRLQVVLAPSTPFLASPDLLRWTREQRDRLGLGVQIHVAETRYEIEQISRQTGTTPLRYLDRFGLVDGSLTAVHCVHVDEADLDLMAERGVVVVYNPKSNMKLGSGIAPVAAMVRRGIPVALGTDGSASNDLLDMFEEMRCAALLQKVVAEDPAVISAGDVFRMATEHGARACRLEAGTLDPGRLADLALVHLRQPHLVPVHDILHTLVYSARGSDVVATVIDGRVVMRDRQIQTVDEERVLDEAERWGRNLRARSLQSALYPRK